MRGEPARQRYASPASSRDFGPLPARAAVVYAMGGLRLCQSVTDS